MLMVSKIKQLFDKDFRHYQAAICDTKRIDNNQMKMDLLIFLKKLVIPLQIPLKVLKINLVKKIKSLKRNYLKLEKALNKQLQIYLILPMILKLKCMMLKGWVLI